MIGRRKRRAAGEAEETPKSAARADAANALDPADGTGMVTVTQRLAPSEPVAGDPSVPAGVLSELLAAFSENPADADGKPIQVGATYDFDDPSLDRLLAVGLDDTSAGDAPAVSPRAVPPRAVPPTAVPPTAAQPGSSSRVADPVAPPAVAPASPGPLPKRIVIGGDDDLPDAQYLDDALESPAVAARSTSPTSDSASDDSGGRSTIVIADLDDVADAADASGGSRRSSGSIDPRLRARRAAVRRAEGRRRLFWVAVVGGAIVLLVGVVAVLASSLFSVDEVVVQGAVYTDAARLEEIIAKFEGEPILLVDTNAIEDELETLAWIERARVDTKFPHRLTIDIRERQPIATFAGSDGRFRVIDRESRVLDVIDGIPLAPMLITGNHPDTDVGQFAGQAYAAAAQLVIALPAEIRTITTSVGVDSATGDLTMELQGGVQVRLGAANDLPVKLARLLQRVRDGLGDAEQVDVSTDAVGA